MTGPLTPSEHSDVQREQSKLRHDVESIRRYGEAHPDEWTEILFENEPNVRIVVLVASADPSRHAHALSELVEYPDQLEVRVTEFARAELDAMLEEVHNLAEWPGGFLLLGVAHGRIRAQLKADQETLASTLVARFGNAIVVRVGALPFPDILEDEASSLSVTNRVRFEAPLIPPELRVTLEGDLAITRGATGRGSLRFHNLGKGTIVLNTNGYVTARILDPSSGVVVGGFVGAQTAPLKQFSIAPGDVASVLVVVGTASFRPELGYVVPSGEWDIDALVTIENEGQRRIPPLPVVITEPSH